jgi:hypothetical protein
MQHDMSMDRDTTSAHELRRVVWRVRRLREGDQPGGIGGQRRACREKHRAAYRFRLWMYLRLTSSLRT